MAHSQDHASESARSYPYTPEDIRVERREVGRDTLFIIKGGAAHIGAVSTAYIEAGDIRVHTTSLPEHKEHLLSEPAALRAAQALNRTVTIVMGIHYDGITKAQIAETSDIVSRRLDEALKMLFEN